MATVPAIIFGAAPRVYRVPAALMLEAADGVDLCARAAVDGGVAHD